MIAISPLSQPLVSGPFEPTSGSVSYLPTSSKVGVLIRPPVAGAITEEALVTTLGQINAGPNAIPQGTDGTVLAVLGVGAVAEVAFGPPISTDETVTQNLLAIA